MPNIAGCTLLETIDSNEERIIKPVIIIDRVRWIGDERGCRGCHQVVTLDRENYSIISWSVAAFHCLVLVNKRSMRRPDWTRVYSLVRETLSIQWNSVKQEVIIMMYRSGTWSVNQKEGNWKHNLSKISPVIQLNCSLHVKAQFRL